MSPTEQAELVAYLDGELGEEEARAVALRLSNDPSARHEAEALARAWDCLDHLPRTRASRDFHARTLTAVTQLALDEVGAPTTGLVPVRGPIRRLAWVAAVFFAILLGFAGGRWLWPDRTARLARDLSLAEHLDEYRDVGSLDFLRALESSAVFRDDE